MICYDCNSCSHINMTEEEQTDKRKDHICQFYNIRVRHMVTVKEHSSMLCPCNKCVEDEYKIIKNNKQLS